MKKISLFLTCLSFLAANIFAQETGTVIFQTFPPVGLSMVKIGDSLVQNNRTIVLPQGRYEVVIWAKNYDPSYLLVDVLADTIVEVKQTLKLCEEVHVYRKAKNAYNKKALVNRFIPVTGIVIFGGLAAYSYFQIDNYEEQALYELRRYEQADEADEIKAIKKRFEDLRDDKIKGSRRTLYVFSGLTLASGALTYLGHKRLKKIDKPIYQAPPPPFKVESLGFSIDRTNQPQFCITLKF